MRWRRLFYYGAKLLTEIAIIGNSRNRMCIKMKENSRNRPIRGLSICLILMLLVAFLASIASVDAASCRTGTFCKSCLKDKTSEIIGGGDQEKCMALCRVWDGDEMVTIYAVFERTCDERYKQKTCYDRTYCSTTTACSTSPNYKEDCTSTWVSCDRWALVDLTWGENPCAG